jgi:hypothetical protein
MRAPEHTGSFNGFSAYINTMVVPVSVWFEWQVGARAAAKVKNPGLWRVFLDHLGKLESCSVTGI